MFIDSQGHWWWDGKNDSITSIHVNGNLLAELISYGNHVLHGRVEPFDSHRCQKRRFRRKVIKLNVVFILWESFYFKGNLHNKTVWSSNLSIRQSTNVPWPPNCQTSLIFVWKMNFIFEFSNFPNLLCCHLAANFKLSIIAPVPYFIKRPINTMHNKVVSQLTIFGFSFECCIECISCK